MARTYTRLKLSAWTEDADWCALTERSQRCYMMLASQKGLSFAGCIPLQPNKWRRLAADSTLESIEDGLAELETARFILIDRDTEEVLIRTFIKHDGGANNTNLSKAIATAIAKIESPQLRAVAVDEFARAKKDKVTDPEQGPPEGSAEDPPEAACEGHPEATCIPNPSSFNPESSILNPSTSSSNNSSSPEPDEDDDPLTFATMGLLATRWTKKYATKGNERGYRIAIMRNAEEHLPLLRELVAERPRATAESVAAAFEAGSWCEVIKAVDRIPHPSTCVCDGTGQVPVDPDSDNRDGYVRPCTAPQNLATIHELRGAS